jgi:hypothetical protein
MCMELELLDKTIRKFEKYLDTYNKNKPWLSLVLMIYLNS